MSQSVYAYMRKENRCQLLTEGKSDSGESQVTCVCFDLCNCPKSRNKLIVTTACWRIRSE